MRNKESHILELTWHVHIDECKVAFLGMFREIDEEWGKHESMD